MDIFTNFNYWYGVFWTFMGSFCIAFIILFNKRWLEKNKFLNKGSDNYEKEDNFILETQNVVFQDMEGTILQDKDLILDTINFIFYHFTTDVIFNIDGYRNDAIRKEMKELSVRCKQPMSVFIASHSEHFRNAIKLCFVKIDTKNPLGIEKLLQLLQKNNNYELETVKDSSYSVFIKK
jgi:hypothetical protein